MQICLTRLQKIQLVEGVADEYMKPERTMNKEKHHVQS